MLTAMKLTLENVSDALWDYRPPSEVGRHELTNAQWLLIRDLFPRPETRRGNPRHPRRLLDGMFWILRTARRGAIYRAIATDRGGRSGGDSTSGGAKAFWSRPSSDSWRTSTRRASWIGICGVWRRAAYRQF